MFEDHFTIRYESENLSDWYNAFRERIWNYNQISRWRESRTHFDINLLYIFKNVSEHYYEIFINNKNQF